MKHLHSSIYRELAAELETPLSGPPVAIFDHHMHLGGIDATRRYHRAAVANSRPTDRVESPVWSIL